MTTFRSAMTGVSLLAVAYFVLWNTTQLVMGVVAAVKVWRYGRRRTIRNRALANRLAAPPLVSIVMPAFNEQFTIVASVRAVLALEYESREIVVVNDGSSDETLATLRDKFQLLAAPLAYLTPLHSAPLRGIYRSVLEPELVVIDKENGKSKADAANAGINAASGTLVLVIDADTVLEPDAISRAVLPFVEDPTTVGVGANVAIANGCRIEHGRVTDVALPRKWLARFQIVEYMRSFLLFRMAIAAANGVSIISGAFGLFRRDVLIEVGGYDASAIGEDMDLTVRIQAALRSRGTPFRIAFVPAPLCWTQAPEDLRSLQSQRTRWRRGLLQVLWRHRRLLGNPRYGIIGVGVLPYTAFFEGLGPLLEMSGYVIVTFAVVLGVLDWHHYSVFLAVSLLFGCATTLFAVLLDNVSNRRYLKGRDVAWLMASAALENLGYRQINLWWGCVGTLQAMRGVEGWGTIKRQRFEVGGAGGTPTG